MAMQERGNNVLNAFDYYVGIPVVFIVGLFKVKHAYPKLESKDGIIDIGMLKVAAIGDTVILSAIKEDIKKTYPKARVTLFVGSSNYDAACIIFGRDNVVKIPVGNPIRAVRIIRKSGNFDVWLDFGSWPRLNALLSWFSKSGSTIGFETKGQYRHYLYDVSVLHRDDIHELENYRNIVGKIGVRGDSLPELGVVMNQIVEDRLIVIHMFPGGSKSYLKEWPENKWVSLVEELCSMGYSVMLTGAPSDRGRAEDIVNSVKSLNVTSVAGTLSLMQTINLVSRAKVVVSVNTGIMHIASALKKNLVCLNGPTSALRWGPLNENAISLKGSRACAPCINLGFEYKCNRNDCMNDISVEDVVVSVGALLGEFEVLSA